MLSVGVLWFNVALIFALPMAGDNGLLMDVCVFISDIHSDDCIH